MTILLMPIHNRHYQFIVDQAVSPPCEYTIVTNYVLVEISEESLLMLKLVYGNKLHRPISQVNAKNCDYVLNSDA